MKTIRSGIRHVCFPALNLLLSPHHNILNKNSVNWFYAFIPSLSTLPNFTMKYCRKRKKDWDRSERGQEEQPLIRDFLIDDYLIVCYWQFYAWQRVQYVVTLDYAGFEF